jgi:hypothetical protein
LYPEAASDDLLLDLDSGAPAPGTEPSNDYIWITETVIGGGGILEEVLRRFAADPRRFFQLADSVLGASDFELVDAELFRTLEMVEDDHELARLFAEVREAVEHSALEESVTRLRTALGARGVQTSHAVMSALHARVLRPGSDAKTDGLLRDLVCRWRSHEERLGIEIDARVFAYLESSRTDYDAVLSGLDGAQEADRDWRFKAISGLLWPRGHSIRSQALSVYHPYHTLPEADRHLLLNVLDAQVIEVPICDSDWRTKLTIALRSRAVARLTAASAEVLDLKRALLDIATQPIELDYLQLYPKVNSLVRAPNGYAADVYVEEALQ